MKQILPALGLAAFTFFPLAAQAQVESYSFDKAHTQIFFAVDHLGYTDSVGQFVDFDGSVTFDRDTPANSSVEVTIDTASLTMNHEKWDAHLHNEDFFNVEKYPEMTFKSTAIEVTGENTANITGDLTLLDVTKPVTLQTTFNQASKHPMADEYHAGFTATGELKRSDFGMNYGLPAVGDDVKITINVELVRQDDAAETAE